VADGSSEKQNTQKIVDRLVHLARAAEPARWASDDETEASLKASQAVLRHTKHHKDITEIFRKMYADVAYKISPSKMDLSIFRSQPYFIQLESTMEELVKWGAPEKGQVSGTRKPKGNVEKKSPNSTGEKKMGFGK
jgi:hypothetical protein